MKRWEAKVLALVGVFLLPFFFTVLPIKVASFFEKYGAKGQKMLSALMCFGGGVFLATFLLHMGPEVSKLLAESTIQSKFQ